MSKTIVALDFSSKEEALIFEAVYRAGLREDRHGADVRVWFGNRGNRQKDGPSYFLDLKLHDIPNTVKGGMKNLARLGVDMTNVHCGGGIAMMKAAVEGLKEGAQGGERPLCIGVTQLTSTSQEAMNEELGIEGSVIDCVLHYAQNAKAAGLDGVVCSVHEAKKIHEVCGDDFLTVTPGIRLASDSVDDQKRVATPQLAKEEGCDYIVVGRSITKANDPKATYEQIEAIMEG